MKVKDRDQMRRWRRRKGFTQEDLALLSGCTQQMISLLETGKLNTLGEDLAIRIAKRLDQSWEDLFTAHESNVVSMVTNDIQVVSQSVPA